MFHFYSNHHADGVNCTGPRCEEQIILWIFKHRISEQTLITCKEQAAPHGDNLRGSWTTG